MRRKPRITIAIQCHNFQRRLCWMLSSLAQQASSYLLRVDIAHVRGNGTPSTEKLLAAFSDRLSLKSSTWADFETFTKRGMVRNRQIAECETEWILFGDADMVYHPHYFRRLSVELGRNHQDAPYFISSGRMSNPKDLTDELVFKHANEHGDEIKDAFDKSKHLAMRRMGNVGAGFSQIINMRHAPHGGFYVDEKRNWDFNWEERGSNPRSDIQFRWRMVRASGPRFQLPRWYTRNAIHLNHDRDPEVGTNIKTQR